MDEHSNRVLVFSQLADAFKSQTDKGLFAEEVPKIELADIGDGIDAWGSVTIQDHPTDLAQLLLCLLELTRSYPGATLELKADDCPGFFLEGKIEIIQGGVFQRYPKEIKSYVEEHRMVPAIWDFMIDARIWRAVVAKHSDHSENQILTTRVSQAVALVNNAKLKDPFLRFPVDYREMKREKKVLKIPQIVAARVETARQATGVSRQELTERGILAGLLE